MSKRNPITNTDHPCFVGIDPGVTGAIAYTALPVGADKPFLFTQVFHEQKCLRALEEISLYSEVRFLIEQVNASPQQGTSSAFTFGQNYGWWLGVVGTATQYTGTSKTLVKPQQWQKRVPVDLPKDYSARKRALKQYCVEEVVGEYVYDGKVTLANADAILLAHILNQEYIAEKLK